MDELLVKTSTSRQQFLRWFSFLLLLVSYSSAQGNKYFVYRCLNTSASRVDFQSEIKQVGSFCMTACLYCLVFNYIKLIISLL